jgi:hypothetical protein
MSRFLPKSLFGQTLAVLLAGLLLSHAAGSWIYTADREQAVHAVGGFAAGQRIANLTRLVQEAPPEWRERIVAALSDQTFTVSLSARPPALKGSVEEEAAAQAIKEFLSAQMPSGSAGQPAGCSLRPNRSVAWRLGPDHDGSRLDDGSPRCRLESHDG